MKKIYALLTLLFIFIPSVVLANKKVDIYLFYSRDCSHCKAEREFLNDYKDANINYFEVKYNKVNQEKLKLVKEVYGIKNEYVPFTVIGDETFTGYSEDIKEDIIKSVKRQSKGKYKDYVAKILAGEITKENASKYLKTRQSVSETLTIPLIGKVNIKNVSITTASILIGLVDGFNPCAMWVLIFLITMLINLKDRKKMWLLGFTFIFTSAVVYLCFMVSWLTIIAKFANIKIVQIIIGIVAILAGLFNFKNYLQSRKKDDGCTIVDEKKRKNTISKIKKFTTEKSYFLALIGVIGLAISVNIIELACSAGLPVMYSNILALNNITGIKALGYLLIYILFFLLDDIIVFTIAMISFKVTGLTTKYTKYSHLIGAIIMLLIGLLMIIKPSWLMFNF